MAGSRFIPEAQDERLAEALQVLASPVRLAVLRNLRTPKTLGEIRVGVPRSGVPERARGSSLARQTVKHHLEQLARIEVVKLREVERDHGPTVEYVANHQRLYALAEDFRTLARLRASTDLDVATMQQPATPATPDIGGPCLVVVKGLEEGVTFRLAPAGSSRQWVIGRRRTVDVPLDFDPYISAENSLVTWSGAGYTVETIPGSRNATTVNFRPLAAGARHVLRTGDVIGVGRSLLLFRG